MSLEKVQKALIQQLLTGFAEWSTGGRIVWENQKYAPQPGVKFLEVYFMPVDEKLSTLGEAGLDEANGLFQVNVNIPAGIGESDSRETIDNLRTCFRPGSLQYGDQGVTILSRSRASGNTADEFFTIPFTVRWRAKLIRNPA